MKSIGSMATPQVSVIIVNLNGERYLAECLDSLSTQTFKNFDVIVVDNGSIDGSLDLLRNNYPWVKIIALQSNTGFAKGNNIGFEVSSTEYIATLNNDTIAASGWLQALYEAVRIDRGIGMVASKILLGKNGKEIDSVGMLAYPDGMTRQRGRGEIDSGQFDTLREVLFPSACAALYRREMLEQVGGFDEGFFSYCEDADLGLRGRLAGWKAVFAPDAVVRHLYSGTGGKYSSFKAYHVERNRFWVLVKDFPASFILMSPIYTIWRYAVQLYGILSGKGSVARFAEQSSMLRMIAVVMTAYWKALVKIQPMVRKRRKIWRNKHLDYVEYRALLKRHRISALELMLKD